MLALKKLKLIYRSHGSRNNFFFSFKGGWFFGGESKINYFWKTYLLLTGQIVSKFQQTSSVFIHRNKLCVILFSKHACTLRSNDWTSCTGTLYSLYYSVIPLQDTSPKVQFLWHYVELWRSQFCVLRHWYRILCSERIKRCMRVSPGWIIGWSWTPGLMWLTKYFVWSLGVQPE